MKFDLAHFRGESATPQMKKYVATAVGVWTSPGIFQQNTEKMMVQQGQKMLLTILVCICH